MSLHNQIMNLKAKTGRAAVGYLTGHRDARHACAEMVLPYDRLVEELCSRLRLSKDASCDEIIAEFGRLINSVEAGL